MPVGKRTIPRHLAEIPRDSVEYTGFARIQCILGLPTLCYDGV
jgi:hypothetical protein